MNLLRWSRIRGVCGISRVLWGVHFLSTSATLKASPRSNDNLFARISPLGDPKISLFPVLDQWVEEGRSVDRKELLQILKVLRSRKRFKHALEISEWMTDTRDFVLSAGETGIRLDLISKVYGEEAAEKYFNSLPNSLRLHELYGALLNSYAGHNSVTKAETTMQKIKEFGFAKAALPYNVMLNLYYRVGDHQKLTDLVQEMEINAITFDAYSLGVLLNAYAAIADSKGVEKLFMKLEADPIGRLGNGTFIIYMTAAKALLKVGLKEKAVAALKKAENLARGKSKYFIYGPLLTLYAEIGMRDDVYRIWDMYKGLCIFRNKVYQSMISALLKLNDLDGAVAIWKEWESGAEYYDFRIPNLLITAYLKMGLLEEAEALFNSAMETRTQPTSGTWYSMACVYSKTNQKEKAVDAMKKAIMVTGTAANFDRHTLAILLNYLKGKGDMDVAVELVNLCQEWGFIPIDIHQKLLKYLTSGDQGSDMSDLLVDKRCDHLAGEADGDVSLEDADPVN